MVRSVVVWLAFGAALATGGCGSEAAPAPTATPAPSGPGSTAVRGHEASFAGAVTRTYEYDDPGITLVAPPDSARPDVSWTTAFRACFFGTLQCVTAQDGRLDAGTHLYTFEAPASAPVPTLTSSSDA